MTETVRYEMEGYQGLSPRVKRESKTFYSRDDDYERLSPVKQEQRDRIGGFILDSFEGQLKYVGFPGKGWLLERQLHAIDRRFRFTGIESNGQIFEKAKLLMPGHRIIYRNRVINDRIKLEFYLNRCSIYSKGKLSSLTDFQAKPLFMKSGTYEYALTGRNAIWYDFTGPMTKEVWLCLHGINGVIAEEKTVPICITLMYGRDLYMSGGGEDGRVDIVQKAIPGFEALDVWQYQGLNDTRMINICGVRRGGADSPAALHLSNCEV